MGGFGLGQRLGVGDGDVFGFEGSEIEDCAEVFDAVLGVLGEDATFDKGVNDFTEIHGTGDVPSLEDGFGEQAPALPREIAQAVGELLTGDVAGFGLFGRTGDALDGELEAELDELVRVLGVDCDLPNDVDEFPGRGRFRLWVGLFGHKLSRC